MRPKLTLQLKKAHIAGEGYHAWLLVADKTIYIDAMLPDVLAADDLHSKLAIAFGKCGIDLLEDLET